MKTQKTLTIGASAMLIAAAGATVSAVDFDPTFQAGQYSTTKAATVVRGTGGSYDSVRVSVPFILPADNSLLNTCAVQAETLPVSGQVIMRPLGVVTTASNVLANARLIAALGTSDLDFPMGSNNAFLGEGNFLNSNAAGTLVGATFVWREAFSSQQNNLGYMNIMAEPQTAIGDVVNTADNLLWGNFPGVGNGSSVNAGSVFTGTPGAARDVNGQLFIGNTLFDGFTGNCPRGAAVYAATPGGVNPNTTVEVWLQDDTIGDLLPDDEANANGVRQCQPHLQFCVDPNDSENFGVYAIFGIGISGGTNLGGGSAVPRWFVVDSATAGDGYANAVFIEADNTGVSGDITNSDINNTAPAFGFIDHQATGGGSGPFVNSQFDMNSSGDVVALWEDTSTSITGYEIRLYKAIWSGGVITGYDAPITIASAGEDGIEENVQDTVGGTTTEIIPMTGPAIDNDGRVVFVALTEAIYDPAAPAGMPDLIGSTNSVMVWEPTTQTLHNVVSGGTNGDVLADADVADGAGGNLSLEIGTLPVDPQGTSDAFSRASLSDRGGFIAVNFRNGVANDSAFGGGVLFNPNMPADTTDVAARGTIIIELGELTVVDDVCLGDCDGSGTVDFNDLVSMLFEFGAPMSPEACDADMSGAVDFNDLVSALFAFGPCP